MRDKQIVYIIGMGMGNPSELSQRAIDCLRQAEVLMGAGRLLEQASGLCQGLPCLETWKSQEMIAWLNERPWKKAALLVSGDPGFYSGAKNSAAAFQAQGWQTEILPGVSSLSYMAARLGKSWEQAAVLSCHGREADAPSWIAGHRVSFLLLGGSLSLGNLCRQLLEQNLGSCRLWAGENFSYDSQRIVSGSPKELLELDERQPFGSLSCLWAENPDWGAPLISYGLADEKFIRGKVPMTKCEVRSLSLLKLQLRRGDVCYDIGSGTGSVAVEMGLALRQAGAGRVYAIERRQEALELTRANQNAFLGDWKGFSMVEGQAPEAFEGLPAPDRAFLGGSGGRMKEILGRLLELNPQVRIVANVISLESLGELLECQRTFEFSCWEMVQVSAAPIEALGGYHMPRAGNPVYIAVMQR